MSFQKESDAYFVKCVLPSNEDNNRKAHSFLLDSDRVYRDSEGRVFKIVPYKSGNFQGSQNATSKSQHLESVSKAIAEIHSGRLNKIVISKIRKESKTQRSCDEIFNALVVKYPYAFVYYLSHPEFGIWMGATPELLLEGRSGKYKTISLAGTQPKQADGSYIWSDKLMEEQQIVTDFIRESLKECDASSIEVIGPEHVNAGPLVHLKSIFRFSSSKTPDEIGRVLHPTPAVCGMPRQEALKLISEVELHERRLYTGFLGISHANGDADYFVNLRCMQIFEDHFELFLGGGITGSSDPESEWAETELKAQVLIPSLS